MMCIAGRKARERPFTATHSYGVVRPNLPISPYPSCAILNSLTVDRKSQYRAVRRFPGFLLVSRDPFSTALPANCKKTAVDIESRGGRGTPTEESLLIRDRDPIIHPGDS